MNLYLDGREETVKLGKRRRRGRKYGDYDYNYRNKIRLNKNILGLLARKFDLTPPIIKNLSLEFSG